MLLCRRFHSQVHLLKPSPFALVSRSKHSGAGRTSDARDHPNHLDPPPSLSTPSTIGGVSNRGREVYANVDENQVEYGLLEIGLISETLAGGRPPCGQSPVHSTTTLLQQAIGSGNPRVIEDVTEDILKRHSPSGAKDSQIQDFQLLLQDDVVRVLSLSTVAALLPRAAACSVYLSENATRRLILRLPWDKRGVTDLPPCHLYQHILYHLRHSQRASPRSVSYTPPNLVPSAFKLINALLPDRQEEAVAIFHVLVDLGHIPPHALVDSSSSQTLDQVVIISLVKASLYWNWTPLAEKILSRYLQSHSSPNSFTLKHATDFIYDLLISPSTSDLRRCLNIIRILHSTSPVLDSLVRQFYDCAADLNAIALAEEMYNFSRKPTILDDHTYPPPQGRALSWLMLHLMFKSKRLHLARTLASDVAQGHIPIPVDTRAQFIAATAGGSFAVSARTLWERYATGKDSHIIHGSSFLMLRMANLFTNLVHMIESKLEALEEDTLEVMDLKTKLLDLRSFTDLIIAKYRQHHEPWEQADHRVLTSYARACFIVGKNTEGFDTFKILLNRKELPDLYDVNVALTAIAKQDIGAAAKVIENMTEYDMGPDAVSLGTVLHHASAQKSTAVIEDMKNRALASDGIYFDTKAFWTVIRVMVEPQEDESRETRIRKLQDAWKHICRFLRRKNPPSLQLGNYLVTLAIEAQDARLAFNFWNVLLKESGKWDDAQQRRQRRAIAQLTQAENRRGEIGGQHSRMIISELQKREV